MTSRSISAALLIALCLLLCSAGTVTQRTSAVYMPGPRCVRSKALWAIVDIQQGAAYARSRRVAVPKRKARRKAASKPPACGT